MNVEQARSQMVEQQVRTWDVLDAQVLDIMMEVPRERFVPPRYVRLAFADTQIPIGHNEVMMAPKVEGRLLQALDIRPGDSILEIGTGSGFLTACLAELGGSVLSVDIHPDFTDAARARLDDLGVDNVTLEAWDANKLETKKSFDVIAITASLPAYNDLYERALKPEGRLFAVVGTAPIMQARVVTRAGENEFGSETLFETSIPPLVNAPLPTPFRF